MSLVLILISFHVDPLEHDFDILVATQTWFPLSDCRSLARISL